MKKVLFLLLFFVVLGTASISAQVRIGGNGEPHAAAVLDLNADDDATPTANKGALALPRISLEALSGEDANLNGTAPIAGMLVYNTNTTLGKGVYFWDGSNWVAIGGDGVVVDAVMDATSEGGLVRAGSGTAIDPYTLGLITDGATAGSVLEFDGSRWGLSRADTLMNWTVTCTTCAAAAVGTIHQPSVALPAGCNMANTWIASLTYASWYNVQLDSNNAVFQKTMSGAYTPVVRLLCHRRK